MPRIKSPGHKFYWQSNRAPRNFITIGGSIYLWAFQIGRFSVEWENNEDTRLAKREAKRRK